MTAWVRWPLHPRPRCLGAAGADAPAPRHGKGDAIMWRKLTAGLLVGGVLAASCGPSSTAGPGPTPSRDLITTGPSPTATAPEPEASATASKSAPAATRSPMPPDTPVPVCSQIGERVGTTVTCVIPRAHCSFREDVSGSPTFCNDAPFPTHSFTLLVWGQDWSEFDGRCVRVQGYLSGYQGQLEIVAESRTQVSDCE